MCWHCSAACQDFEKFLQQHGAAFTSTKEKQMKKMMMKLWKDEEGATMVEYGVMVALIAAISIGVVQLLGANVFDAFTLVNNGMP
jgi:pilus assembly protein Flp/PilA